MRREDGFSTLDIMKHLKLARERFRIWVDKGFITPSVYRAKGAGESHRFDILDVYKIALFRHLVEIPQVPCKDASRYVEMWRNNYKDRVIDRYWEIQLDRCTITIDVREVLSAYIFPEGYM